MPINIDDIAIISFSIDTSDVYHWYFMKFYHYDNVFWLLQMMIYRNTIYKNKHYRYYYNDDIRVIIYDIAIIFFSIDTYYDVYHWYFKKFYHYDNIFRLLQIMIYRNNIDNINNDYRWWYYHNDMPINIDDMAIISSSIDTSNVYPWYFMKFLSLW